MISSATSSLHYEKVEEKMPRHQARLNGAASFLQPSHCSSLRSQFRVLLLAPARQCRPGNTVWARSRAAFAPVLPLALVLFRAGVKLFRQENIGIIHLLEYFQWFALLLRHHQVMPLLLHPLLSRFDLR